MSYLLNQQKIIQKKLKHPTGIFQKFEIEETEQSVPARFEQQVEKYPDMVAIKDGNRYITYEQLNGDVNRLARAILEYRGDSSEPVVLLLEHGNHALKGIYGVLKAGKFYVPLDPTYPFTRNEYMLADSQTQLIVTDNKNLDIAKKLADESLQVINIDRLDTSLSDKNLRLSISPDSLANITYTSGSTGQPKGVLNNHRNLLHIAKRHTNALRLCPDDRVSFLRSYSFNGALKDIFASLLNGASIYPFNLKEEGFASLASWLAQEKITLYCSVATTFRQFASNLTGNEDFSSLRVIYTGGEVATRMDVELYKKYMSDNSIFGYGFGTAETSTVCQFFIDKQARIEGSAIPVGYPTEDMDILLLDENHKDVGFNEEGEIAVRSNYIALGYWQKPEHTRKVFLSDSENENNRIYLTGDIGVMLPDGCLIHKGRRDHQVKVRGYRIETAEVEVALTSIENIKNAAVVVREDKYGYQRLIAYIIPYKQANPNVSSIRRVLAETLPDYMIPSVFVFMDSFPVSPSTKLDYKALPEPPTTRPELENPFIAHRTPLEKELAGIWSQFLNLDEIGIYDNFFDLGGHSLLATRVISRVANELQVDISLKAFFQSPTLADMALIIAQSQAENAENDDVEKILTELDNISDEEAQNMLANDG
jgi:amino acid adenylation domain-containing protein